MPVVPLPPQITAQGEGQMDLLQKEAINSSSDALKKKKKRLL